MLVYQRVTSSIPSDSSHLQRIQQLDQPGVQPAETSPGIPKCTFISCSASQTSLTDGCSSCTKVSPKNMPFNRQGIIPLWNKSGSVAINIIKYLYHSKSYLLISMTFTSYFLHLIAKTFKTQRISCLSTSGITCNTATKNHRPGGPLGWTTHLKNMRTVKMGIFSSSPNK